jgi:hypothetical protein
MMLSFESNVWIPSIAKSFSSLLDKARICIDNVHYDKVNGIVEINTQRRELIGFNKTIFGEMQPVYSKSMINSLLKIRHVNEMDITVDDRLRAYCNSYFTVLFGLKVEGYQMYLSSVEEMHGTVLCQIFIKVNEINIEYADY